MGKLILVRHSAPEIDLARPAYQWTLSAEGRARCIPLADALRPYQPDRILSSTEPKAQETAAHVADHLRLPWTTADGLHEHERPNIPFVTPDAFRASVASFFHHPDELVFGAETAAQAYARFALALQNALALHPTQTTLVVTHGTVMSLYLAHRTGEDAFKIWQTLKMPDFVVFNSP